MPTDNDKRTDFAKSIQVHMTWTQHPEYGDAILGWVHTHGMAAHGLPELEIRGVPTFMMRHAGMIVNQIGYLLHCKKEDPTQKPFLLGELVALAGEIPFRLKRALPHLEEDAGHYEDERWRLDSLKEEELNSYCHGNQQEKT